MDRERRQLMERDAVLPRRRERERIAVGGEHLGTEAAEQAHHGEIELAMPTVGGGVDQPAVTGPVHQSVAGPQVAVQPGGRLGRAAQLGESVGDRLEPRHLDGTERALVGRAWR